MATQWGPLDKSSHRVTRRAVLGASAAGAALVTGACGWGGPGPAAAPAALSGRVQILWWDTELIIGSRRRSFDQFRVKYPQLQLEIETTGGAGTVYFDKLYALLASDLAPDVYIITDSDLPAFLQKKLAYNLEPLVRRDRYDLSDFPKAAIDLYRHEGGLYGLPDNITSIGLFVNVELFRKAGVPLPPSDVAGPDTKKWAFDGFLQVAQQLADRLKTDPPTWPISPTLGLNGVLPWIRSNGGDLLNKDRTATALDEPAALEALQFLADLRHRYRVAPKATDPGGANPVTLFEQGRLAMADTCVCQLGRFRANAQFEWDAGWRPAGKAGLVDHLFAYPLLIAASTKNPEGAWAALKWYEDEGLKLVAKEGHQQGTKINAHERQIFAAPSSLPPKHIGLYVTSVEKYGRVPPGTTNWQEVSAALTKELNPLWNGQRTAREAALQIKQTVDPLVKAGRWPQ